MGYGSLRAWLSRHDVLEARWAELWVASPEVGPAGFREGLSSLSAALRLHVDQEERHLLPAWERVPDPPPNATAEVLRRDHRLLLELLDATDAAAADRRTRVRHLHRLREVLQHHDAREAASIKPGLDAVLDPERVTSWLDRFAEEEAALPAPFRFEPGARGVPEGSDPEDAVVADAPALAWSRALAVPEHPKGAALHARAVALAAEVDGTADARARRLSAAELWGALRRLRVAAGER